MKWVIRRRARPGGFSRTRSEPLETRRLLAAAISGTVYNDFDADGVRNGVDYGLTGATVYVDANANGAFDAGEPGAVAAGVAGTYTLDGLAAPATYLVRLAPFPGFTQTDPGPPGTNAARVVTVADGEGQAAAGVDFGAVRTATLPEIHGAVFRDLNENGTPDAGETNASFVTVYLDTNDNGVRDGSEPVTSTTPNGYQFSGLFPGTYVVRAATAFQQHVTSPSPFDDAAHVVTLSMSQHDNRRDFGVAPNYAAASFGPIADAHVRDGDAAGTVFGSDPQLLVQRSDAVGSNAETYVRLDVSNYPDVRSFKLRLFSGLVPGTGDGGPVEVAAYAQGGGGSTSYNWTEANLTWNNRPGAANDTPVGSITVTGTEAQWYELDLSTYVRQVRATGQQSIPIVLKATSAGGSAVSFASRNNADQAIRPRELINVDADPPVVTQVLAGGSGWTKDFKLGLQARSMGAGGFVLPPGGALGSAASSPAAPQLLPWTNVNTVRVRFNENVSIINTKALVFTTADGTRTYPSDARFDTASLTATWTFAKPFAAGRYTVAVDPSIVKDASGNPLDAGAWLPLQLNVLPGDVTRDGRVNAADLYAARARLGSSAGGGASSPWTTYSPFADVHADGRVDAYDYAIVRARQSTFLPPVAPALFGAARVGMSAAALVDSVG